MTAYLLAGFLLVAWEVAAVLVPWIAVPATITVLNLSAMGETYRASREPAPAAPTTS